MEVIPALILAHFAISAANRTLVDLPLVPVIKANGICENADQSMSFSDALLNWLLETKPKGLRAGSLSIGQVTALGPVPKLTSSSSGRQSTLCALACCKRLSKAGFLSSLMVSFNAFKRWLNFILMGLSAECPRSCSTHRSQANSIKSHALYNWSIGAAIDMLAPPV